MKASTRDRAKGTAKEQKGRVKQTVGTATDNPRLEAKGAGERMAGRAQKKTGQIKKDFGR